MGPHKTTSNILTGILHSNSTRIQPDGSDHLSLNVFDHLLSPKSSFGCDMFLLEQEKEALTSTSNSAWKVPKSEVGPKCDFLKGILRVLDES